MFQHILLLPIHMIVYLLSCVLTAYAGVWLARRAGVSVAVGALSGLLFHVPGLLVLAGLWLINGLNDPSRTPPVQPI
jgi:hypothetical protein